MVQLIGYAGMLAGCGVGIAARHRSAGIGTTVLAGFAAGLTVELVLVFLLGVQLT